MVSWRFGWFILFGLLVQAAFVSGTWSTPLILDNYGEAVELRRALQAPKQQSSLVMVIDGPFQRHISLSNNEDREVWVVSTTDRDEGDGSSHLRPQRAMSTENDNADKPLVGRIYRGSSYFLNPILSKFSHSFTSNPIPKCVGGVAVVCVGVQGDAEWLLGQLHEFSSLVWERSDSIIDVTAVLPAISALFRQCATRYPFLSQSYGPSLGALLEQNEGSDDDVDSQQQRWARPLGVCALVLDLSATAAKTPKQTRIFRVDPSGLVEPIQSNFVCLGKHAEEMEIWWKNRDDKPPGSPAELCQALAKGLIHNFGEERAPRYLKIEMWWPKRNKLRPVQRSIISLKEVMETEIEGN